MLKKYFYVLRPILAVNWIDRGLGVVPTEFEALVQKLVKEPILKKAIDELIRAKRESKEVDYGPRVIPISEFIERELARFENYRVEKKKGSASTKKLDALFLEAVDEVWGL